MSAHEWKGYDGLQPLNFEGRDIETREKYKSLLHRVDWKIRRSNGKLAQWDSRFDSLRDPTQDAYMRVGNCGQDYGIAYECSNGCMMGLPFGCSSRWCLRCEGIEASKRSSRVQKRTERLAQGEDIVWGRAVFTVHSDHAPYCSSKAGSILMQSRAADAICTVLKSEKTQIFGFTTFHPTSSKNPHQLHPHVELIWYHAKLENAKISPMKIHETGILSQIELDYLKDIWGNFYPRSTNLNISYTKELKYGLIRYLVRPMAEDVWYALEQGRLALNDNPATGSEPLTIPARAEAAFREDGGVIFWKGYHRVRYFGAMRNDLFGKNMFVLNKPHIIEPKGDKVCPCCEDGVLAVETSEGKPVHISVGPFHSERHTIMFTNRKSGIVTGAC